MSDGMRRELVYLSSYATNRYFIPNWGIYLHPSKSRLIGTIYHGRWCCGAITFLYRNQSVKDHNVTVFHVLCYMDKNNNICLGETLFPDCPVRNILARVDDKWSLLLMHQMIRHQEPMRFSDLKKPSPTYLRRC